MLGFAHVHDVHPPFCSLVCINLCHTRCVERDPFKLQQTVCPERNREVPTQHSSMPQEVLKEGRKAVALVGRSMEPARPALGERRLPGAESGLLAHVVRPAWIHEGLQHGESRINRSSDFAKSSSSSITAVFHERTIMLPKACRYPAQWTYAPGITQIASSCKWRQTHCRAPRFQNLKT